MVEKQKADSRHDDRDENDECPDDNGYGLGASKYANFTTMTLRFRSANINTISLTKKSNFVRGSMMLVKRRKEQFTSKNRLRQNSEGFGFATQ